MDSGRWAVRKIRSLKRQNVDAGQNANGGANGKLREAMGLVVPRWSREATRRFRELVSPVINQLRRRERAWPRDAVLSIYGCMGPTSQQDLDEMFWSPDLFAKGPGPT